MDDLGKEGEVEFDERGDDEANDDDDDDDDDENESIMDGGGVGGGVGEVTNTGCSVCWSSMRVSALDWL